MADHTREQAIEACSAAARESFGVSSRAAPLALSAILLTRDGKLRERLLELVESWRNRVESGSDAATWFMAADELASTLKEGEK